jgi:hypothetical protein
VHQFVSNKIPTEVPGCPRIPIFGHLSSSTCSPATKIASENSAASSTIILQLLHNFPTKLSSHILQLELPPVSPRPIHARMFTNSLQTWRQCFCTSRPIPTELVQDGWMSEFVHENIQTLSSISTCRLILHRHCSPAKPSHAERPQYVDAARRPIHS